MLAVTKSPQISRRKTAKPLRFAAPVRGLDLFSDVAQIEPGFALILENAVCQPDVVRPRGGSVLRNTGFVGEVRAILPYRSSASRLFAVAANDATDNLYDVTLNGAVGAPMITGLAPSVWSFTQFGSSGGSFLVAVSAGNTRRLWDGAAWSTSPAITGVTATSLSQVWQHGNRLWFVESGTSNAWYLGADAIGGAATAFPLTGIFSRGGSLVAGATWTSDAGASGQTATCLFMSSEGEIAVYDGLDPATWSIIGTYFVGKPCGINCFLKTGGDVVVMTEDGMFAMSQVVSLDAAALVNQSVSKNIRPLWRAAATATNKSGWQITRRDNAGYAIVSVPATAFMQAGQFVINLQTGAWSTWRGWAATTFAAFGEELVFGSSDGKIYNGDTGGRDVNGLYSMTFVPPYQSMAGRTMTPTLARAIVRSAESFESQLTAMFDYSTRPPVAPSAEPPALSNTWDSGKWDEATWDAEKEVRDRWQSVGGIGEAVSICMQYTFDQGDAPDIEIIRIDCSCQVGEFEV